VRIVLFSFALAAALNSGCASAGRPPEEPAPGAPLADVMDAIAGALTEAQTGDVAGLPPLRSVAVKLQTAAVRSAGGQIGLVVFSAGASRETETVSTLELKFKPAGPPPKTAAPVEIRQALAKAIHLARAGAARAGRGSMPLATTKVEIELKFAVEVKGSAGLTVELMPLGAEAGGKIQRNAAHTIVLVFGE